MILGEDEGFDYQRGDHPFLNWWQQQSTGLLHCYGFESLTNPKSKNPQPQTRSGISWQRMRDSNPRKRSQSPVCYRYTNPLCVKHGYYYIETAKKVKHFFQFLQVFPGQF